MSRGPCVTFTRDGIIRFNAACVSEHSDLLNVGVNMSVLSTGNIIVLRIGPAGLRRLKCHTPSTLECNAVTLTERLKVRGYRYPCIRRGNDIIIRREVRQPI